MEKTKTSHVRPYWHIDAKWITGILLFLSLSSSLLLFNLSQLTERDTAVNLSATIIAGLFSKNGLDDVSGIDVFRQQAANAVTDVLHPITQFPSIAISKQDALTLSPRDLRIAIFSQITGPIYDKGLAAAAAEFTSDPAQQNQFSQQASALQLLNKTNHILIQNLLFGSVIVTLILLGVLIYFSAGWGRLVSPGVVLLAVSPIGSLAALILLFPPSGGGSSFQSTLPPNVASSLGNSLAHSYVITLCVGAALLVIAFAGKIITTLVTSNRSLATIKTE